MTDDFFPINGSDSKNFIRNNISNECLILFKEKYKQYFMLPLYSFLAYEEFVNNTFKEIITNFILAIYIIYLKNYIIY